MKRQNLLLICLAALLVALPLYLVPAPEAGAGGEAGEAFAGTDSQAQAAIAALAPDYTPWFAPLFEPPGGEVETLLFALQAALGAGFIGFWLGGALMRERLRRDTQAASTQGPRRAD